MYITIQQVVQDNQDKYIDSQGALIILFVVFLAVFYHPDLVVAVGAVFLVE